MKISRRNAMCGALAALSTVALPEGRAAAGTREVWFRIEGDYRDVFFGALGERACMAVGRFVANIWLAVENPEVVDRPAPGEQRRGAVLADVEALLENPAFAASVPDGWGWLLALEGDVPAADIRRARRIAGDRAGWVAICTNPLSSFGCFPELYDYVVNNVEACRSLTDHLFLFPELHSEVRELSRGGIVRSDLLDGVSLTEAEGVLGKRMTMIEAAEMRGMFDVRPIPEIAPLELTKVLFHVVTVNASAKLLSELGRMLDEADQKSGDVEVVIVLQMEKDPEWRHSGDHVTSILRLDVWRDRG